MSELTVNVCFSVNFFTWKTVELFSVVAPL